MASRSTQASPAGAPISVSDHRAEAGMEADERPAADRDARRSPGHHVVVAGPVVALIVADRTHEGDLVHQPGQLLHVLREDDAWHFGGERFELAANLARCSGLGVERLVVGRPTVHPDEDARLGNRLGLVAFTGLGTQGSSQSAAEQCAEPDLQAIATRGSHCSLSRMPCR